MQKRSKSPYKLPESIDGSWEFTWGPVQAVHRVPALDIVVVEYLQLPQVEGEGDAIPQFHLHDSNWSFDSLEVAVIYGIARRTGADTDHVRSACYLLGCK
jgi:hypothetical protein